MDGVKQVQQQHDSSGEDDSAVGEEWQVGGGGDWKRLEDDADSHPDDHPHSTKHASMTSDAAIHHTISRICCNSRCLSAFSANEVHSLRHFYFDLTERARSEWLLQQLKQQPQARTPQHVHSRPVCQDAYMSLYGFSPTKLRRVRRFALDDASALPPHGNEGAEHAVKAAHAFAWLDTYLRAVCDIYTSKANSNSNSEHLWLLPARTTRRELYGDYLAHHADEAIMRLVFVVMLCVQLTAAA